MLNEGQWSMNYDKKQQQKKQPKKTKKKKHLDFIPEHRNLQITKLFCPSVLDCALKTPKAKHLFCSMKTKQRCTRQSWKSLFCYVQPTEVADTQRGAVPSFLPEHTHLLLQSPFS